MAAPLAAQPLSDFQKFRSYPYMDRAYREAGKDNWPEVERLMRHLLGSVPNNQEARTLLVEALAKQRRYADAESVAKAGGDDERQALMELRLAWIEQDPPAPEVIGAWLAHSQGNDRVRLWQAYSLSLGKRQGPKQALDWLDTLSPNGDGKVLREARANWAEQLRDWTTTIDQLAPLAANGQLGGEDWQRLANAYAQRLDEAPLEALLKSAPSPEAARRARQAMAQRAIAVGNQQLAQRWLPDADQASPEQREQLLELARQSNDAAQVQRLSNDLRRPCLETVDWLSGHDRQAALQQLRQCRPEDSPQAWLVLAQRLGAVDLLGTTTLPEPWDAKRREILVDTLRTEGRNREALAYLARQPQTPNVLRQRAELLQAAGRRSEAARLWENHYRQTGSFASLDQASYLTLDSGDEEHARQLLEQAFDRYGARMPAPLLKRLADLESRPGARLDLARAKRLLAALSAEERGQLIARLAESGHCDLVQRQVGANPTSTGELRALGRCAMPGQPGSAVVYYQTALARGDQGARLPLAYALDAAGDPAGALRIWRSVPDAQLDDAARLTAARDALAVQDLASAERYWQQARRRGADDWALGASIAGARNAPQEALARQRQALQHQPDAGHFYAAAGTAQRAGDRAQSTAWLAEAVRRAPDNPRYRADYGMRLASADTPQERRQAIPYLQRATRDYPEDYRLGETLAWRYDEAEDSAAARAELRRVIDLEQQPVAADDDQGSMEARRFRQRRAHQTLSQRDNLTLASTWSPAGITTVPIFNPDTGASKGQSRRAKAQNVQTFIWDHALGEEPTRNGSTLSVYGRALTGNEGRKRYAQFIATGLGLRYKPFGAYNLNLYGELYKQNTIPADDPDDAYPGERLHHIGTPEKFERYMRRRDKYGQTSTDFLLRATASFLDQGEYRNDWRVDEDDWDERFLYLDAAWWTHAGDHQWVSRYQQGHAWKLPTQSPQTLMPYGFGEFSAQDPDNDWRQDLRSGVGLRWQYWYGEDRYNAYRAHVTVRTEFQWGLAGNLYEQANGWLVGLEVNF
ncbi:NfrA family protein [Pseudomonas citronellolis]|uniref:NfrA family protein n=1 Tax=Pseudomonas citronellolis TaxID=53408 RepID=UPI0023E3A83B|nr:phage receptor [Pseudomonas citronellolis]MDF3935742.1 phage receptor [Pseudomonas citronellolis]